MVEKIKRWIPPEWRAPLVFFIILVIVMYYLYGGIAFEETTLEAWIPLAISIAIIAVMTYLRRFNEAFREFMTPGNVIFFGVIITGIVYLIWLGLT